MTDGLKRGDTFIMSDFFQIFKKVNGWNQLKDYSAYEKYSRNISSMNDWLVDVSDKFLISF